MQVSGEEMRAARAMTGATFAAFFMVPMVPRLRAYAGRIRLAITVFYLLGAAGFMGYLLFR